MQDTDAEMLLNVPGGQSPEQLGADRAVLLPNRPAPQLVQSNTIAPPMLNRPEGHEVPNAATEPLVHANPGAATHMPVQLMSDAPSIAPYRPAGQSSQLVAPLIAAAYNPTGQAKHDAIPTFGAYLPDGHAMHDMLTLKVGE